jgi:hypothetical protein
MTHDSLSQTLVKQRITLFANTLNGAIFTPLHTDTRGFVALGANQHHIRNIDRAFKFNNAWGKTTALRLNLALMLFAHVDALHSDTPTLGHHFDYFTTPAFILVTAADDFNSIAFFNLYFHFTRSCWHHWR